jgi:integrase/recombinase XerD
MFEQLFKCPDALARQRHGPLAEERRRYLVHCAEQQMSPRTLRDIAIYTLAIAKALGLADRPDELVTRAEIEAEADRWANRRPKPPTSRVTRHPWVQFTGHACRWLKFLGRLRSPTTAPRPYAGGQKGDATDFGRQYLFRPFLALIVHGVLRTAVIHACC